MLDIPDGCKTIRKTNEKIEIYHKGKRVAHYPFLPCPICNGIEGCDHTIPERARAAGLDWHDEVPTNQ